MSEPKYALDGEGPSGIVDPRRTNLITIRDVARRAQVSNSTVSRVFGPPYPSVPVRVNDETRRRVEAAAAEADIIADLRGSASYKRELLRVYTARAVRAAIGGAP